MEQNADDDGFETQLQDVQVILGPRMAPNDLNVFKVTSETISITDGDGCGSHFEPVEVIWGNFGVIMGHFGTIPGQFVAPNSKLLQTSHVTTQNNRKRSRALMKMVPKVTLKMRSFWAILGSFWGHFGTIPGHF